MKFRLKTQQAEFVGAYEQFVAYVGGIGTGKSTALIAKALFHSQESPNNLGVIVRKNYTDLRSSTIKDFQDYTGFKVNENTHEVKLPNGSTILFMHGDVLDSLKNINAGFIAIEQAEDFADSSTWDMLIQRLRRQVKFRTGFLIANANGHNWVWEKFIRDKKPNHLCVQATTYDFADLLPSDYITNLEQNLPERMFKRYVMNSHEIGEGKVYDEYDESKHVIEPYYIPETMERGFVLDHGFRNPTAVLFYAIDWDGNIILYDEHYQTEKPVSYHAEQIKTRKLFSGIADPSIFSKTQSRAEKIYSIADEYAEYGITLEAARREEEFAALGRVNEFFKAGKIRVFNTLKNARQEFANWRWRPVKPGADPKNKPEEPEDYANHLADCLKYLIQSRFPPTPMQEAKSAIKSLDWFNKVESNINKRMSNKPEGWEGRASL